MVKYCYKYGFALLVAIMDLFDECMFAELKVNKTAGFNPQDDMRQYFERLMANGFVVSGKLAPTQVHFNCFEMFWC